MSSRRDWRSILLRPLPILARGLVHQPFSSTIALTNASVSVCQLFYRVIHPERGVNTWRWANRTRLECITRAQQFSGARMSLISQNPSSGCAFNRSIISFGPGFAYTSRPS